MENVNQNNKEWCVIMPEDTIEQILEQGYFRG